MRTALAIASVLAVVACDKKAGSGQAAPTPSDPGSAAAPSTPPAPGSAAADPWNEAPVAAEDCKGRQCAQLATSFTKSDPAKAAALFAKGCETDDGISCAMAGVSFKEGMGVARDIPKAVALYDKACTLGYAKGCYNLALMLANGDGVPADLARGITLMEKACAADAYKACGSAGDYYLTKGQKDKARPLLERGCNHKDALSCETLAKL